MEDCDKQPNSSHPVNKPSIGPATRKDIQVFIDRCAKQPGPKISEQIKKFPDLWKQAWISSDSSPQNIIALVEMLTKAQDGAISAPPINECCQRLRQMIDPLVRSKDILETSEILLNAVGRLLDFEWNVDHSEVKECLQSVLGVITGKQNIHFASPDHRRILKKVMDLLESLDKPWFIKVKTNLPSTDVDLPEDCWQTARIKWLSDEKHFNPMMLPKMKVPNDKGSNPGVYASHVEYYEILKKLWTAVTFHDGWKALNPGCRIIGTTDQKPCGNPLVTSKTVRSCHCSNLKNNCGELAEYSCSNPSHRYGLCKKCYEDEKLQIRKSGHRASTDIYDGDVSYINWEGKISVIGFKSRRPPKLDIHWRTTRRLCAPNLVGIVKVEHRGATLRLEDAILWGEIVVHDKAKNEYQMREQGRLRIKPLEVNFMHKPFDIQIGDHLVIIDCQSFVPETIPILGALDEQQKLLVPFEGGTLFNIAMKANQSISNKPDSTPMSQDIHTEVNNMVSNSAIDGIIQIRRDSDCKNELIHILVNLVSKAKLDENQFRAFLMALTHPVHCTQGPPGTGKSYLGVVLIQALLEIRELWMKVQPSIGSPPVLVLSYKNHSIDELLLDLVKETKRVSLIRLGGGCKETGLTKFEERYHLSHDPLLTSASNKLKMLTDLHTNCKEFIQKMSKIRLFNRTQFETLETIEQMIVLFRDFYPLVKAKQEADQQSDKESEDVDRILRVREILLSPKLAALQDIQRIADGVKHYMLVSPWPFSEVLWKWMTGFIPRPACAFDAGCNKIAGENSYYCEHHCCQAGKCVLQVTSASKFCKQHLCQVTECKEQILADQIYCPDHICVKCLELNKSPAGYGDSARRTCQEHPLCSAFDDFFGEPCNNIASYFNSYCENHISQMKCKGMTNKKPCQRRPISIKVPYCKQHAPASQQAKMLIQSTGCAAKNSKNKPCRGFLIPQYGYCKDHLKFAKEEPPKIATQPTEPRKTSAQALSLESKTPTENSSPRKSPQSKTYGTPTVKPNTSTDSDTATPKVLKKILADQDTLKSVDIDGVLLSDDGDEVFDESRIDRDNLDEIELPDHLQQLHDVYQEDDDEVVEMINTMEKDVEISETSPQVSVKI